MARTLLKVALATVTFAVLGGGLLRSQTSRTAADWPAYGATNAGSKYSPLDQINKDTVKGLRIAWRQSALPLPVQKVRPDAAGPARLSAHAAEGGRPSLHEHVARDRRRARPDERRSRLVRSAAAAGRRQRVAGADLLDRRQGRTDHRDLRPVPGRAEREDRTALRRLRDGRRRRSLPGLPPRDPRRVPVGRPCHHRARRHRRRGHARRRGGHHQRDRARADGDPSRRHPRLRRPHREAAVDVPHRAVARGVRERDLAERFVVLLRQRRRLVVDGGGRRARVRVSADRDADRRLLRRHAPWQQPLCRKPGGPGRQDRQTCLAFPGCPPRHLGLRLSRAARSRRRHGRWPPHQGDRADLEAGVRLRARSGDGTAGLADRRAAGRAR